MADKHLNRTFDPTILDTLPRHTPIGEDKTWRQVLEDHFWCDFSDLIPAMQWDDTDRIN